MPCVNLIIIYYLLLCRIHAIKKKHEDIGSVHLKRQTIVELLY